MNPVTVDWWLVSFHRANGYPVVLNICDDCLFDFCTWKVFEGDGYFVKY